MNKLELTSTLVGIGVGLYVGIRWLLDTTGLMKWQYRPSIVSRWWNRKLKGVR